MTAKKRGYSRDFTPRTTRRVTICVNKVPPTLKADVLAKCKRTGTSLRSLILSKLKAWLDEPRESQEDQ